MVGNKLTELKLEIDKYLGVPYFSNTHHLPKDNVYVGKGTAHEIALETIEIANKNNIKLIDFSNQQIYNFQKKHHLGIDCSGLACHLLNVYLSTNFDVRKTSADMLTSPPISKPSTDIQTGDLIRVDSGKHVIFIVEKIDNIISYVHNSEKTKIHGVHYGTVTSDFKTWSDVLLNDRPYSTLFHPSKGDGIFKIKI